MLPLSPNCRPPIAFFSLRYRQTPVQSHFNSFIHCKCLKQIFARNRFSETPKQTPTEQPLEKLPIPLSDHNHTTLGARECSTEGRLIATRIRCPIECEYYGQFAMLLLIIRNADLLFNRGHHALS